MWNLKRFAVFLAACLMLTGLVSCGQEEVKGPYVEGRQEEDPSITVPDEETVRSFADKLRLFAMDPADYTFFYNSQVKELLPTIEYLGVREQLNLEKGDKIPGYFWSEEEQVLYALNEDKEGVHHLYAFQRNPNASEETDYEELWLQIGDVKDHVPE